LPTELVVDNGIKLKAIVTQLCINNKLDEGLYELAVTANDFYVVFFGGSRIVAGKPSAADKQRSCRKHVQELYRAI
jgi:hypothetical protein